MNANFINGKKVYFHGKLAAATRRRATELVRNSGGAVVQTLSPNVNLVIVGEADALAKDFGFWCEQLGEQTQNAFENGTLDILSESAFWNEIARTDTEEDTTPLFTPTMLAELLEIPVATIRLWFKRGLIVPIKMVRSLPYFDFQEILTAKTLRDLLRSGLSPAVIEKRLQSIRGVFPDIKRPLAQLSVIVEGKDVLLRKGGTLIDQRGQRRIDFDAYSDGQPLNTNEADDASEQFENVEVEIPDVFYAVENIDGCEKVLKCLDAVVNDRYPNVEEIQELALALEEEGKFQEALSTYRAALAAGGADPDICLQVAELLYRLGDLSAARERYYMVLEIDENNLEARANLGCVLAELGDFAHAVSAFEGALKQHPGYADVHYHLGNLLWKMGKKREAKAHFTTFLKLHPESPWSEQVREMIEG
ncbi:MAG: tetratricopeptide repeat protein [Thermoguttaceae bacterium]